MAVQKVMSIQMAAQMQNFRRLNEEAAKAEAASAKSATDAKTAAEQTAAIRADLQRKQSQLQIQIAAVKSRYVGLTPEQKTALAGPGPLPPAEILAAPAPERCRHSTHLPRSRSGGDVAPAPMAALPSMPSGPGEGEGASRCRRHRLVSATLCGRLGARARSTAQGL